jgi:hypothetical protein
VTVSHPFEMVSARGRFLTTAQFFGVHDDELVEPDPERLHFHARGAEDVDYVVEIPARVGRKKKDEDGDGDGDARSFAAARVHEHVLELPLPDFRGWIRDCDARYDALHARDAPPRDWSLLSLHDRRQMRLWVTVGVYRDRGNANGRGRNTNRRDDAEALASFAATVTTTGMRMARATDAGPLILLPSQAADPAWATLLVDGFSIPSCEELLVGDDDLVSRYPARAARAVTPACTPEDLKVGFDMLDKFEYSLSFYFPFPCDVGRDAPAPFPVVVRGTVPPPGRHWLRGTQIGFFRFKIAGGEAARVMSVLERLSESDLERVRCSVTFVHRSGKASATAVGLARSPAVDYHALGMIRGGGAPGGGSQFCDGDASRSFPWTEKTVRDYLLDVADRDETEELTLPERHREQSHAQLHGVHVAVDRSIRVSALEHAFHWMLSMAEFEYDRYENSLRDAVAGASDVGFDDWGVHT